MKKFACCLTILICSILPSAHSQAITLTPLLEASATVRALYNFETGIFALSNSAILDFQIELVKKSTLVTPTTDSDVYGWFRIEDLELKLDDGVIRFTDGRIDAKVIRSPFFITILYDTLFSSLADPRTIFTVGGQALPNLSDDIFVMPFIFLQSASVVRSVAGLSYLITGYETGPFIFLLRSGTGNTVLDPAGTPALWVFEANTEVLLERFLFFAEAMVASEATGLDPSASAEFAFLFPFTDRISLKPVVALDLAFPEDAGGEWAVGAGFFAQWGKPAEYKAYVPLDDQLGSFSFAELEYQGGVGLGMSYGHDGVMNLSVQANDQPGLKGILSPLSLASSFELFDVTNVLEQGAGAAFGLYAAYRIRSLVPFAHAIWLNSTASGLPGGVLMLDIGLELDRFFPNTVFRLEYQSTNVLGGRGVMVPGVVSAGVTVKF